MSARGPRRISSGIARDGTSPVARIAAHSIFPAKQFAQRITKPPLRLPCQTVSSTGLRTSQRSWSPAHANTGPPPPHGQGLPCPSPPAVFPHPGNRRAYVAESPAKKKTERHMRSPSVCRRSRSGHGSAASTASLGLGSAPRRCGPCFSEGLGLPSPGCCARSYSC